ncbi:TerC family protein [Heyndrickxia sp. NPDC080065]|uniref:TerC family protein n=1 Tax=Heyndrickxia sp. NPDC080065 TaxID=3390568 RepID=UPI003CFEE377
MYRVRNKKRGVSMHEIFKVFFINLVCDIDNMLILGIILRKHSHLKITLPAAIVLTLTRTTYIILIDGLSNIPLFQLLTGIILLFIAYKVVTRSTWEDDFFRPSRSPFLKVKVLLLLAATDFLLCLDGVIVISRISQHVVPVATGIFCSLLISLLFFTLIIRLAKTFFWINFIAGGFIAQNAIIGISKDPWLADWIHFIDHLFPRVNIVNIIANGVVILIIMIGLFAYIKEHRITIWK